MVKKLTQMSILIKTYLLNCNWIYINNDLSIGNFNNKKILELYKFIFKQNLSCELSNLLFSNKYFKFCKIYYISNYL